MQIGRAKLGRRRNYNRHIVCVCVGGGGIYFKLKKKKKQRIGIPEKYWIIKAEKKPI